MVVSLVTLSTCAAGTFKGPWGLQLYSLRTELATNVPGTLDEVKSWGVKNVELAGTYDLTPKQFKAQLHLCRLNAVSGHFSYDEYRTNLDGVIHDAKVLGIEVCRMRVDSARRQQTV